MSQIIKIKRGTELARTTLAAPEIGEILYTNDDYGIWFGDGSTIGGIEAGYLSTTKGGTVSGPLTVTGNLTVNGEVTTSTSNDVIIGDSIMVLNNNSAATPSWNAGFEVERGDYTNVSILWHEGDNEWQLTKAVDDASAGVVKRILDEDDIHTAGSGISLSGTEITNSDLGSSQLFYKTFTADSGTDAVASANEDSIAIVGSGDTTTASTADTITITSPTYTASGGIVRTSDEFTHATGASWYHLTDDGGSDGRVLTASSTPGAFTWELAGAATNDADINLTGSGDITVTSSLDGVNGLFTTNQNTNEEFTFAHSSDDGSLHVSATSTTNNLKVLTAGASAGTFDWADPQDASTNVSIVNTNADYITVSGTNDQTLTLEKIDWVDTNLVDGSGLTISTNTLSVDYGNSAGSALEGDSGLGDLSDVTLTTEGEGDLIVMNGSGQFVNTDTVDGGTF